MSVSTADRPLIVTGFGPFAEHTQNPSQQLVEHILGLENSLPVEGFVLPVSAQAVPDYVEQVFSLQPRSIVALGLGDGPAIRIEQVALNLADFRIPDVQQFQPQDQAIMPTGPACYFSTLPTRRLLQTLLTYGIPAVLSQTAGTYLCNYWLYTLLHRAQSCSPPPLIGFIHVPQTPAMVAQQLLKKPTSQVPPSMSLENMQKAVALVLQETILAQERNNITCL